MIGCEDFDMNSISGDVNRNMVSKYFLISIALCFRRKLI